MQLAVLVVEYSSEVGVAWQQPAAAHSDVQLFLEEQLEAVLRLWPVQLAASALQ